VRLDSGAFVAVFAVFFLVHAAVAPRFRRWLLVLGSVAFYATLNLSYVPLFLASGLFTYAVGGWIHRAASEEGRDRWLWLGVGLNVATLAFFKAETATAAVLEARHHSLPFNVAIPLGVSFYTLQAISYLVDVHRRLYAPPASVLSFLASFTLFPHLLSGPIVRSSSLVPQVERASDVDWPAARRAMLLFTAGLVKKAVADRLAPIADGAFDGTGPLSVLQAWTGLLAYAAQLYADFSGYTDMATAACALLGLELPKNFDLPYLATSPADFWRRWHISLSAWLRDYVYLPLGVRFRRQRTASIVATWILAGLWHGATWLYLLYGLYHGVLLAVTDWLARRFDDEPEANTLRGVRRALRTLLTFYLVCLGYVLFRSHSLATAGRYLLALHVSRAPSAFTRDSLTTLAIGVAGIVFGHLLDHLVRKRGPVAERPWLLWPAMALAVAGVVLFGGTTQPFIYFAF
jgi:D-alanyl-lipoteichoic acid acyltransferase DltB (MBOAT superfamily)